MNTQTIYSIALVTHIMGFTMMAGITLADYIMFNQFWKHFAINTSNGSAIRDAMSKFVMLLGLGFLLIVISGVAMMAITHGAFGEQTWFRIKFGLVVLILINGIVLGRRQGVKLKNILTSGATGNDTDAKLLKVKNNIRFFHLSQLTLFIIIFVLSVFKFN